jgi:hypothetical protein
VQAPWCYRYSVRVPQNLLPHAMPALTKICNSQLIPTCQEWLVFNMHCSKPSVSNQFSRSGPTFDHELTCSSQDIKNPCLLGVACHAHPICARFNRNFAGLLSSRYMSSTSSRLSCALPSIVESIRRPLIVSCYFHQSILHDLDLLVSTIIYDNGVWIPCAPPYLFFSPHFFQRHILHRP